MLQCCKKLRVPAKSQEWKLCKASIVTVKSSLPFTLFLIQWIRDSMKTDSLMSKRDGIFVSQSGTERNTPLSTRPNLMLWSWGSVVDQFPNIVAFWQTLSDTYEWRCIQCKRYFAGRQTIAAHMAKIDHSFAFSCQLPWLYLDILTSQGKIQLGTWEAGK